MRSYDLGNPELDKTVTDLVAQVSNNDNGDLIREMIVTVLKLHRDAPSRGDLKLVNTALKEMRYSMLVFSRHDEPKVTIFGSARLADRTPTIVSPRSSPASWWSGIGAWSPAPGPGIMEAGNRGAGIDASYGVNIRLPFEANANEFVSPEKTVNFKYFFTRKLGFVKESHGFALFPGGFGTLDETFELLTLIQTGKSDLHPIVMLESEGTGYWGPLVEFMQAVLTDKGLISPEDTSLFTVTNDPTEAADVMCRFYANFHSQRYVDGTLVLRLRQAPDPATLARLSDDYRDIIVSGDIETIEATDAEVRDE